MLTHCGALATQTVMLIISVALAYIIDPCILILLCSRIYSYSFLFSSVKEDIGPKRFINLIRRFLLVEIPLVVLIVVLLITLTTTVDPLTLLHYVTRRWLLAADYILVLVACYVLSYSLQDTSRGHNDIEGSAALKKDRVYAAILDFIKNSITNVILSIFVFYVGIFTPAVVPALQNYLVYNNHIAYVVALNCLLTPAILCLQMIVLNIFKNVSNILQIYIPVI